MFEINNMDIIQKARLNQLQMEQDALKVIFSSNKEKSRGMSLGKDSYIRQSQEPYLYADYTESGVLRSAAGKVSKEDIWDYLNNLKDLKGAVVNNQFVVNGKVCDISQIEKLDGELLTEMKAVDNVLTFESGVCYGVTTRDGGTENTWGMKTGGNGKLYVARSETLYALENGIMLKELGEWKTFFSALTNRGNAAAGGITILLDESKVKRMMDQLGFEPGMCTIMVDGKENTFFYGHDGRLYPKYQYDGAYIGMTQGDNLINYEVGDEFNYNGTIYRMDQNGHINVPYGEDIFNCLSRPESKFAKKLRGEMQTG